MSAAELITMPQAEIAQPAQGPMAMLALAMSQNSNFDFDKLAKVMEFQERWEANEARKAYYAAMAEFKKSAPQILKNKHVVIPHKNGGGTTEYDQSTLDHVCDQVIPALAAVGISHKWVPSNQTNGEITITCILTHALGFSEPEPAVLRGPLDTSGSKNAIQAIGSSCTYLERYTLLAAVGMAAKGTDDDGRTTSTAEDKTAQPDPIRDAKTMEDLHAAYKAAYKAAEAAGDTKAMTAIIKAKDTRKAALQGGTK